MTKPIIRGSAEHQKLHKELWDENISLVCSFIALPEARGKTDMVLALLARHPLLTLDEARVLLNQSDLDPAIQPSAGGTLVHNMQSLVKSNVVDGPGSHLAKARDH